MPPPPGPDAAMLRPSQGSILSSSRAAQRRTARKERARAASGAFVLALAVVAELFGGVFELLLLLFLPIAYAVAAFLTLSLPLRVLVNGTPLSLAGVLGFLAALGVSAVGVARAAADAEPVAPVSRGFARLLLILNWVVALLLALGNL